MEKFHVLLPASLYKRITNGYLKTLSKYELSNASQKREIIPANKKKIMEAFYYDVQVLAIYGETL